MAGISGVVLAVGLLLAASVVAYALHPLPDQSVPRTGVGERIGSAGSGPSTPTQESLAPTNISGFSQPNAIAFDSKNQTLFVLDGVTSVRNQGRVSVLSTVSDTIVATRVVGSFPDSIVYDSQNNTIFVGNEDSDNLTVLNASTYEEVDTIAASGGVDGIAWDSSNGQLFVGLSSGGIEVFDGDSYDEVTTISTGGGGLQGMVYDNESEEVFAAEWNINGVVVVDAATDTFVTDVTASTENQVVAFDWISDEIFAFSTSGCFNATVINGQSNEPVAWVTGWCSGGSPPDSDAAVFDAAADTILIANPGSQNITVVSAATSRIIGTVPLRYQTGATPNGFGYDNASGNVYVSDVIGTSGNVTLIPPSTPLSVSVAPSTSVIPASTNETLVATPICMTLQCANPSTFLWTSSSSVDGLNSTSGSSVLFTGLGVGTDSLSVSFSLLGYTVTTSATASVVGLSVSVRSTILDVEVGGNTSLSVSTNCTGAPCAAGLAYSWSLSTPIGVLSSSSGSLVKFTGDSVGNATLSVAVSLDGNPVGASSANLSVVPVLVASLTPAHSGVDVNASLVFKTSLNGGRGAPYSYAYTESILSANCDIVNAAEISCRPLTTASFSVSVNVTDAAGDVAQATSVPVSVAPALLVQLVPSNLTPLLGQTVAFVTSATGGVGPYTYNYSGFPPGCVSEDEAAIGCLPTQADFYNVTVAVTDQNDVTVTASAMIHVIFDFNVIVPANTSVGSPFTISVNTNETFAGGTALSPSTGYGVLTYNYSGLPPGCTSEDLATIICTPSQVGTYHITVSVHDQVGDHQTHTVVVNVVPSRSSTASGGIFSGALGYALIGGGVAALLLISIILLYRARKKRRPSQRETPTAPTS